MPTSAPRPCTFPGCGDLASGQYGRCPGHEREADARKGSRRSRSYDAAFYRAASQRKRAFPVCEGWPVGACCPRPSEQVDHIDGNATGPNHLACGTCVRSAGCATADAPPTTSRAACVCGSARYWARPGEHPADNDR